MLSVCVPLPQTYRSAFTLEEEQIHFKQQSSPLPLVHVELVQVSSQAVLGGTEGLVAAVDVDASGAGVEHAAVAVPALDQRPVRGHHAPRVLGCRVTQEELSLSSRGITASWRQPTPETLTSRPQLTEVVLLDLADVTVQRTVSEQNQHDGVAPLLAGGHDVGGVSHHSILLLGPGGQEDPGLVLDVENPELAGHVPRGVDLSSVHEDLPLEQRETVEQNQIRKARLKKL